MIVLDVESTGTDPQKHSILSIGALDLREPDNQFYDECRAWDGAKIEDEALAVNGFSREEATESAKKSEAELITAFVAWACDRPRVRTLAAQNVSFDYDFVKAACERAGIDFPFPKRTIDVHTLAWSHMLFHGTVPPEGNHRSLIDSKAVLAYCGLPEEPRPHNAMTGALWHAEVIARMAYTKNLLPDFSSYPIPWTR